jgi:hypothetical protein
LPGPRRGHHQGYPDRKSGYSDSSGRALCGSKIHKRSLAVEGWASKASATPPGSSYPCLSANHWVKETWAGGLSDGIASPTRHSGPGFHLLSQDDYTHRCEDYPANQVASPKSLSILLGITRLQRVGHRLLQDLRSQVSVVRQQCDSEQHEDNAKYDGERTSHSDDSAANRALTPPGSTLSRRRETPSPWCGYGKCVEPTQSRCQQSLHIVLTVARRPPSHIPRNPRVRCGVSRRWGCLSTWKAREPLLLPCRRH